MDRINKTAEEREVEMLVGRLMAEQGYTSGETWQPFSPHSLYEVSNFGRVRRAAPGRGTRPGYVLKVQPGSRVRPYDGQGNAEWAQVSHYSRNAGGDS